MNQINLSKCKLIVNTYPDYCIDWRTIVYFLGKGLPITNLSVGFYNCSLLEARNRIIRDMVLPYGSAFDWYIFLDKDVWPSEKTDKFFDDVECDIMGCMYSLTKTPDTAWLHPTNFHTGFFRAKPEVFQQISAPWYMFEYNHDGTLITGCECEGFRRRALERNFKIERRGAVNHLGDNTWHPCN